MEQTVVTQPKRLQPKKPRRRITPATVCQAIHDVPYIVARALIRAVRAVGHCFAWTWDAIASDVRANWRAFCCGRLVTGCRDALRSPALREVHHIMRDHPSIRIITMIAVTAVIFAAAVMAEPVRTMDVLRKAYLKKRRRVLYTNLKTSGKLTEHLAEIEQTARKMVEQTVARMAQNEGVTETLKATDPLRWTGLMNNLRHSAEELVLSDLIYA